MESHFTRLDWAVLILYFLGILSLGLFFWRRSRSTEEFTAGGRSLPGWLCGLSIFATYLSSISYLALPGKSFVSNWNPFVFSLALPVAAAIAVRYFIPMYRAGNDVSAYALLERRFGVWARVFASGFYLLFQVARIGVVMYLMALPMAVIFGWNIRTIIVLTGVAVTAYSFVGGIVAVIWADAIQAVVLLAGALIAVCVILWGMPEGPGQVFSLAEASDKFSWGSYDVFAVSESTVWIVLLYGLFENLKNFGIDQSYIQRYIASRSDAEAKRGLWLSAALYVPVSALFFFIGTSLFAFYETHPQDMEEVKRIVARQRLMQSPEFDPTVGITNVAVGAIASTLQPSDIGDRVFPHFIAAHLPAGMTGLLIAAVFAAAMSTVSTSLNSSATLVMSDFYQRFARADADERQCMRVLYLSTIAWGVFGTGMALVLVRLTESALDIWWTLSSVLGAGIIGLFLLGLIVKRAGNVEAIAAVALGMIVVAWMTVSKTPYWPETLAKYASPFHSFAVIIIGCCLIVGIGAMIATVRSRGTTD